MESTRTVNRWTAWSVFANKGEVIRVLLRTDAPAVAMIGSATSQWYGDKPAVRPFTLWAVSRVAPETGNHSIGVSMTGTATIDVEVFPEGHLADIEPPTPPAVPWSVSGTDILGADGKRFRPYGANIGVNVNIGGTNYPADESVDPHTAEALEWGWNTVRFTVYCSDEISWIRAYGVQKAIDRTFVAAQKYLDAGFVVILALMDITAGNQASTPGKLDAIENFISQAGARFVDEPRLWVNVNEPVGVNTAERFQAFHGRYYDAFRATGNNSIFVVDFMTNSQDASWGTAPKVHSPDVGPAFLEGRTNVVFSLHNYGGQAQNSNTQEQFNARYTAYLQTCATAGLAMIIGETGYRVDGRDQAGGTVDVNRNVRGFRASLVAADALDLGVLVWDGTFDLFGLKNTKKSAAHSQPFWYQGASGDLSPMGQEFWTHCHPQA